MEHVYICGQWSDIAAYKDGAYIGAAKKSGESIGSGLKIDAIGWGINSLNYAFNGSIDEVRIYNRTLTPKEIMELYRFNRTRTTQDLGGSPNASSDADNDNISFAYKWFKNNVLNATTVHDETNLIAYYPFDYDARDHVGSNDGTVSGAVLNQSDFMQGVGGYSFDGLNDAISVSSAGSLNITGNFSASVWIKPVGNKTAAYPQDIGVILRKGFYLYWDQGEPCPSGMTCSGGQCFYVFDDPTCGPTL